MILYTEGMILTYSGFLGVISIILAAIMHGFLYIFSKKNALDINVFTFNTLPIGISGSLLCLSSILFESPNIYSVTSNSWLALIYLGVIASVGGFIIYFHLLKRMNPIVLSFIFIIFPVIAIVIDAQYKHREITTTFVCYSIIMLLGFAFTKIPIHRIFMQKNARED